MRRLTSVFELLWASRGRIVLLAMVAVFVWLKAVPCIRNLIDASDSSEWKTTSATVVRSETYSSPSRRGGYQKNYAFRYEYVVDRATYIGSRYSFADSHGDQKAGTERHSADDRLTVFYSPVHPARSVVIRTAGMFWTYLTVLTFALLVLVGSTMAYSWIVKVARTNG